MWYNTQNAHILVEYYQSKSVINVKRGAFAPLFLIFKLKTGEYTS